MKKMIRLLKYLYFTILILLCLSPFWPPRLWWLATLFQIAPLWVLYVPLCLLYIWEGFCKKKGGVYGYIFFLLVITIVIMGFSLNITFDGNRDRKPDIQSLRVITANLGEGVDKQSLFQFFDKAKPDIIFLQEVEDKLQIDISREPMFNGWYMSFNRRIGILSKFKIKRKEFKSREFLGKRGILIVKYDLEFPNGLMSVLNLHLDTIGDGVEAFIAKQSNAIHMMKNSLSVQEAGSSFSSRFAETYKSALVAGDFNMRDVNPMYIKDWSNYSNAFARAGFGFGYTRYTSWHGVRIDHVLYDSQWKASKAYVGPDLGGDHRPLVVDLEFIGESNDSERSKEITQTLKLEEKDFLVLEQFETTVGGFLASKGGKVSVDSGNTYLRGSSLKVQSLPTSKRLRATVRPGLWNLRVNPGVSFSYRIPKDTSVALRVKTQFDDWICLGGVKNVQCPDNKVKSLVHLIDDDEWHEIIAKIEKLYGNPHPTEHLSG